MLSRCAAILALTVLTGCDEDTFGTLFTIFVLPFVLLSIAFTALKVKEAFLDKD